MENTYEGKPCKRCNNVVRYKSNGDCVTCANQRSKAWRSDNRVAYNDYQNRYINQSITSMMGDDEEIWFEKDYRKRKKLKQATPKWTDPTEIRRVYQECIRISEETGVEMVVDHIIPISNPTVCGLHIPENLKVVSRTYKKVKGNKFSPK